MSLYPEEELTEDAFVEISEILGSLVGRRNVGTACNGNCVTLSMFENFKKEFAESVKKEIDNLTNDLSSKVEVKCNYFQSRIQYLENELSISRSQVDTLHCNLETERNERRELAKKFSQSVEKFTGEIEDLRLKSSVLEERIFEVTSSQVSSPLPTSIPPNQPRNAVFRFQGQPAGSIEEGFVEWNGPQSKVDQQVLLATVRQPPIPQNGFMSSLSVFQPEIEDISPASTPTPEDHPQLTPAPASPRAVAASTALLELVQNYRRPVIGSSNQVPVITYFTAENEDDDSMISDDDIGPDENQLPDGR